MKKRKTGRDESVNGNEGDDEGFESSPEKVTMKFNFLKVLKIQDIFSHEFKFLRYTIHPYKEIC